MNTNEHEKKDMINAAKKSFSRYEELLNDDAWEKRHTAKLQYAALLIAYRKIFGWKRFFMVRWWRQRHVAKQIFLDKTDPQLTRYDWSSLDPRRDTEDPGKEQKE
jgi:hypothetical protein